MTFSSRFFQTFSQNCIVSFRNGFQTSFPTVLILVDRVSILTWRDSVVFSDVYSWITPSAAGAALLVLLFQCSTAFTESITAQKYPEYREYQKVTSMLAPLPPFGTLRPPAKKSR